MDNFTAIPNELFDSDFWSQSKLSHQAAFIDLFRMRRNSPSVIEVRGEAVTIEKDQAFVGIRKLSKRWGVSKDTASRYLKIFEKTGQIKTEKSRLGTRIIFLCFSRSVLKIRTPAGTQIGTPARTIQDGKMKKMNGFRTNANGLIKAYCSKCGIDLYPTKFNLYEHTRCCDAKLTPNRPEPTTIKNEMVKTL